MDDNDIQDSYEINEFMIDDNYTTSSSKTCSPKRRSNSIPSKNELYSHESDGSKSFGAGTGILILMVFIIGIVIALATQESNPIIGLISTVSSLVIVFKLILGGEHPKQ